MATNPIYKTDDTGAFGNNFITVNLSNPLGLPISKVIFACGCITKTYVNPVFPWVINLSSEETKKLKPTNICYLVAYDEDGLQRTCKGTLTFNAIQGVLPNGTCC